MKNELNIIIEIAKEAGKIIMKYYKKNYEKEIKNNDEYDFLTTADKESERYIIEKIKENFPDDFILSEETETRNIDYSSRVWMVDPLDGTKDFVHHGVGFAVMIGLCVNGKPKIGVVYAPAKDILYYGEKRKGSYKLYKNKRYRLKVGKIRKIKDSRLIIRNTTGELKPEKRVLDILTENLETKEKIPEASMGLKFGLIAENKADAYVLTNNRAGKWDACAPQIILEEAGGKVSDFSGRVLNYKQSQNKWQNYFIATNKVLHDEILKNIKKIIKANNISIKRK